MALRHDELSRVKLVQNAAGGGVDYKELERPTVMRNQAPKANVDPVNTDPEYLDIPAFLRRQAD